MCGSLGPRYFLALLAFHAVHGYPASMPPALTHLSANSFAVGDRMPINSRLRRMDSLARTNTTSSRAHFASFVSRRSERIDTGGPDPVIIGSVASVEEGVVRRVHLSPSRDTAGLDLDSAFSIRDAPVMAARTRLSRLMRDLPPLPVATRTRSRSIPPTPSILPPPLPLFIPPTVRPLTVASHRQSRPSADIQEAFIIRRVIPGAYSPLGTPFSPMGPRDASRRTADVPIRRLPFPPGATPPTSPVRQSVLPPSPKRQTTSTLRQLPQLPAVDPVSRFQQRSTSALSIATSAHSDNVSTEIHRLQGEMRHIQRIPESNRHSLAASQSSHGTTKPRSISAMWSRELPYAIEKIKTQTRPQSQRD
ncbi:hypothetical protein C8J57DRAFT_1338241 [Mycena rebaudengoi]|nr:hypothetical protein C8J57DRAFT_1338241 [Mycena rebaudengoi]